eukprot:CAMPEP_0179448012 /NCGR_PEP_ID=MMETSP0799-20121207/31808_1 /TAXON_ID=46947 /ORGANISM="Geminigera cryophila, Strain CCMP2564" /LENGTH=78 /DNA_ID=CAMNT_0021239329 /DNA_START=297 /DNA_END=533 /DNA_ORIENTATION=+
MCDTGAFCHDGFVKSSRAFKILGDRGNGSTDSEYVNGHRESHFGGFAPIESQKLNDFSMAPYHGDTLMNGGPGKHQFF